MFQFEKTELVLRHINKVAEKAMPILTPTGVILGLLLSSHISWMKPAVVWLFAFLTLVNGMSVNVRDFVRIVKHPLPIAVFAFSTYILLPLIVYALGNLFFQSADVVTGYILLYCIPTAVAACIWCGIYGGNMALSLTILVLATCLAPLVTPFSISLLSGASVELDIIGMVRSLFLMVVIPSILGVVINAASNGRCNDHISPCLKPFTKLGLLLVIIINTSQVADRIIDDASLDYIPQALSALLFTSIGFMLAFGLSRLARLGMQDTVSVVYASGMHNISAALVMAIDFFPPASAIPVISGIVLQQSTCAIISYFLFGRKHA